MFTKINYDGPIAAQYTALSKQLDALLACETNTVSNLSNASALLNQFLTDINWVGFYWMKNGQLILGPFQGLPACFSIPVGRGVCGTAVAEKRTMLVEDVHAFPGHIACDAASKSEIVIPLIKDGEVIGVLDIDSPLKGRFTTDDQQGLEQFVETLLKHIY
ncbi:MAG: GAF domain-containing protein [Solibacillus sp.]